MTANNPFTYSRSELRFYLRGKAIDPALQKAGAEALIKTARFNISDISLKLQQGKIDTAEWYAAMKEQTKLLHMGQAALARGGFENMSAADWKKVEPKIFDQWAGVEGKFPGLRRFAEDVERGRYGRADGVGQVMNGVVTQRSGMYADSSRATYENTRTEAHTEAGYAFGTRVKGAVDSCPTCINENGVKRPIADVVEIGDSECGAARCHCILLHSRT